MAGWFLPVEVLMVLVFCLAALPSNASLRVVAAVSSEVRHTDGTIAVWSCSGGVEGSRWLTGINVTNGTTLWRRPLTGGVSTGVKVGSRQFAILEGDLLSLRSLDSGSVLWSTNFTAIPRQTGLKESWFTGKPTSAELATTNCDGSASNVWQINSNRISGCLIGAGPSNLLVFRQCGDFGWDRDYFGSDWISFDAASGVMVGGAKGRFVGAVGNGLVVERCGKNYWLADRKITRWPYEYEPWHLPAYLVDEHFARSYVSVARNLWVLRENGRPPTMLPRHAGLSGHWTRSASNLFRSYAVTNVTFGKTNLIRQRIQGFTLAGKLELEASLPRVEQNEPSLVRRLGERAGSHYFSDGVQVFLVTPGQPAATRIAPVPGETTQPSDSWGNFSLSDDGAILLETAGCGSWLAISKYNRSPIPTNRVVSLIGRDAVSGKVLWTKTETVAIKRPKE